MAGWVGQAGDIGLAVVPDRAGPGKGKTAPFWMGLIGINPCPLPRIQGEGLRESECRFALADILHGPALQVNGGSGVIQQLDIFIGFGIGYCAVKENALDNHSLG